MEGVTLKFTKQQLLFKKYDARTIKFEDIEAFCEAEGVDFTPDTTKKIAETMLDLAKVVRKGNGKKKDVEEKTVTGDSQSKKPVIEEKKQELPGYLARRQDKIKAEQAQLAHGLTGQPVSYGEDAPGFLKRRFGGK